MRKVPGTEGQVESMGRLKVDLREIYRDHGAIEGALERAIEQAVRRLDSRGA